MKDIANLVLALLWIAGIVLANGFWSTFFAIFFPLWAWCVAMFHFLAHFGIL